MNGQPSALDANRAAWEAQARLALPHEHPREVPSRFEWSQYPGIGPGAELLGDVASCRVVELGCGTGDHVAYLAALGGCVTGVDVATGQIARAVLRWRWLVRPGTFVTADVMRFLASDDEPFDLCYSVFGAIGLSPTQAVLTLARERLPSGRLVFVVPHRDWLGPSADAATLPDGSCVPVRRFLYDAAGWLRAVERAGFQIADALQVESPDGRGPCCIVVSAL
jgi:SAM-dependent methyltransferase